MVFATVDLGGRFAHNCRVRQTPQPRSFDRNQLKTTYLRERVIRKFLDNIDEIAGQRASVVEEAREFTEAILGAAHAILTEARRASHRLGWCERPAVRAALLAALKKSGRHADSARPNTPQQRGKRFELRARKCERRSTRVWRPTWRSMWRN